MPTLPVSPPTQSSPGPHSRIPLHPRFKGSPEAQPGVTHLPVRAGEGTHSLLALLPVLPALPLPKFPPSPSGSR